MKMSRLDQYRGAIYMGIAACGVSYIQLGTKLLARDGLEVPQMLLMRNIAVLVVLVSASFRMDLPYGILGSPAIRHLLVIRAVIGNSALLISMTSLTLLPLGDAVALALVSPTIMLLLSPLILKEPFGCLEFFPLVFSSLGVVFVAKPPFLFENTAHSSENGLGMFLAVAGATLTSTGELLVRKMRDQAHLIQIVSYFSALPILPISAWCYLRRDEFVSPFSKPAMLHTLMMVGGALVSQIFMSKSLQIEKVSKITPVIFLQILFAFSNDWLFFGVSPSPSSLAGAALIAIGVLMSVFFY